MQALVRRRWYAGAGMQAHHNPSLLLPELHPLSSLTLALLHHMPFVSLLPRRPFPAAGYRRLPKGAPRALVAAHQPPPYRLLRFHVYPSMPSLHVDISPLPTHLYAS